MSLAPWEEGEERLVADMRIFELRESDATNPRTGRTRSMARVRSPHWVNVVGLTPAGEVVLVKQWRHGVQGFTLEVPGGMVDPGESPRDAAVRELREESGFTGSAVHELGVVQPNPAVFDNLCYSYLVEGATRTHELEQDDGEDIEVSTLPLADIPAAIADGRIQHALVVCAFHFLFASRPPA